MVNEALNKLRRTTSDPSTSLLIDHNDYTSAEGSSFITNPSRSPPATLVTPIIKHTVTSNQSGCEKRAASDSHNLSLLTPFTSGSNPSKRSKISSSSTAATSTTTTSFSAASSSKNSSSNTSSTENCRDFPFFDIHDKLRELYGLLYYNDEQNRRTETRVSFQFFLLSFHTQNIKTL